MKRLNDTWTEKDGKIFCNGRLLRGVDAKSFRVINDLWATDGKDIYDEFGKVKSIKHPPSFCSISGGGGSFGYGVDDVAVYYKLYWAKTQELRGVDRETASWISEGYLKDRKSVWFKGTKIKKADPDSFEVVSGTIGLDERSVYFTKHKIEGACPEGFRKLHGKYISCANGVWYQNKRVPVANIENFEKFRYDDYGTDGESVFYQYNKIQVRNLESVRWFSECYLTDEVSVFYYGKRMKSPDPRTFRVDHNETRDDKNMFCGGGILFRPYPEGSRMETKSDLAED